MIISQSQNDEQTRVTKHEAGHYIVNRAFGYVPTTISLTYNKVTYGYSGGCEVTYYTIYQKRRDLVDFCKKRCIILLSGSVAGALNSATNKVDIIKAWKDFNSETGLNDKIKYDVIMNFYINFRFGYIKKHKIYNPIKYFNEEFMKEAVKMVEENLKFINGIGNRLLSEINRQLPTNGDVVLDYTDFNKMPSITKEFGKGFPI
ncbi:MAG: hypothetical protein IK015_00485 [Treponema sp.]|nr:hypothetical protein [Treponema sp.]